MASNEETHILNLIRNLLLEEKERERVSSRFMNSETLLNENSVSTTLPSIGSLSELMATSNVSQTGINSNESQSGLSYLMPSSQSTLNYLNLSQFDPTSSSGSHSIDDLLGLIPSGVSCGSALPQSLVNQSDEANEANSLLVSNYASLVSSPQSISTSMPLMSSSFLFDSSISSSTLLSRFESQIRCIANDIQTTIQLHLNGLQMRKEQLLKQLEHIKQTYATVLSLASQSDESTPLPLPQISFTRPDSALYKAVTTLGFLTTPAFAVNCCATGDGVELAIEGEATCFTITTRNCFNEELLIGGEHIDIEICVSEGGPLPSSVVSVAIPHSLLDHNNGKYTVTYTIPRGVKLRQVSVSVAVNGLPITGSPFLVSIETQRTRNAWKRIATFGTEGAQIGQFCRPWGVAIVRLPNKDNFDMNGIREYLIAVADRSNNRIQLLKLRLNSNFSKTPDRTDSSSSLSNNGYASAAPNSSNSSNGDVSLSVVHVFGSGPGTRPGQFDRPAGIAINVNLGHIIVADKDNHRIQVFDISGTYLFKFGDKGSRPGQFCYPWDIDSCPQTSQILVSDTRNRRVQLFTPYGQYLWHCGQPLDSPRGVSFISSDKFVISDFNKHRLLIIDKTNNNSKEDITPKYIGFGEGSAWGEFLRPQGVVSSGATSIFCADSRNNRISIWNSVTQSFDYLTDEVISLDRPSGLSVADNLLVVVDFGNNRIQICQR